MVFHEYERSLFVIMDDGYPPVSILILIGFILLEAVFYGFGSAIQNVNEGKLEEEAAGGTKKAARLLEIVNRPVRFVHTIQVTTHLMGMIIGAAILPAMIGMVERRFLLGKVLACPIAGTNKIHINRGNRSICTLRPGTDHHGFTWLPVKIPSKQSFSRRAFHRQGAASETACPERRS